MNQFLVGLVTPSTSQIDAMDCYRDSVVDEKDCVVLSKFLLTMIHVIPVYPE